MNKFEALNKAEFIIELSAPLPAGVEAGYVIENLTCTPDAEIRNCLRKLPLQISSIQFLFYIIRIFKSFQNCHFKIQLIKMSTRIIEYNITGNHKKATHQNSW